MRVLVASGNPVKRAATAEAFRQVFAVDVRVAGRPVPSGVPDQPLGGQTWEGAINRARALAELPEADGFDWFVGLEGGIERQVGRWFAFGAMCVRHRDGREGLGSTARFELPPEVMAGIEAGEELGAVIDALTGERGSKRRGGAIEWFTAGAMDRTGLYVGGVVGALARFVRSEAWAGAAARPWVEGIVETGLYVDDLDRSEAFYRRLFGGEQLFADDRLRARTLGTDQVLLLFLRGGSTEPIDTGSGTIPPHDGHGQLHVAFGIDHGELAAWERMLAEAGVTIESRVRWPRGGVSLYFRDPDDHAVELVTRGCWQHY